MRNFSHHLFQVMIYYRVFQAPISLPNSSHCFYFPHGLFLKLCVSLVFTFWGPLDLCACPYHQALALDFSLPLACTWDSDHDSRYLMCVILALSFRAVWPEYTTTRAAIFPTIHSFFQGGFQPLRWGNRQNRYISVPVIPPHRQRRRRESSRGWVDGFAIHYPGIF